MDQEFKESFSKLDLEDKKNFLSNELIVIGELINMIEKQLKISYRQVVVKNYDLAHPLDENKTLDFFYEDIYVLEREVLNILSKINDKKN